MAFPGITTLRPGWEKVTTTTKRQMLGAEGYMFPGRWFKYGLAGEAVTTPLLQTPIAGPDVHDLDLSVAAAAIGALTVTVTIGAAAIVANEFQDGFLIVNDGTGEGLQYLIKSHPAGASTAAVIFTLDDDDPIRVALVASGTSEVGLVHSQGFDFVVYPTTVLGQPLGAACVAWADNDYGWLQFRGPGLARGDAAAGAIGVPLIPSNATAGNLELGDTSGTYDAYQVAVNMDNAGVSGEQQAVLWGI